MFNNQDLAEIARNDDQDHLIIGFKRSYDYFDDQTNNIHVQIVPEIQEEKEEENSKKEDLLVFVPDEHSETDDHHHHDKDYSESLRIKDRKPKRRCIQISSDEESSYGFTREVPSMTRKGSKRRRKDNKMMSNKMRTLQQLVPNCHKMDKVSVLDKTIEYMKDLQLQLKVMSRMGMNPYIPQATLDFGMHNHLLTAMAMVHRQNPANQTTSSLNWPLPLLPNPSFPHSSIQYLFATQSQASSPWFGSLFPKFP